MPWRLALPLVPHPRPAPLLPQAVFKVQGSNKRFPAVNEESVTDMSDMGKRSVLDGDAFLDPVGSCARGGGCQMPWC